MTEKKELIQIDPANVSKISCGLTDEDIIQLADNCKALKINGVDDKEGYEKVYEAHQIAKKHISNVTQEHKKYKAVVTYVGGLFDSEKKRLLGMLEPISLDLKIKREVVDKEAERIKAENQRIKMENHQKQIEEIIKSGAFFDGSKYVFGEDSIDDTQIWNLDEENFKFLISRIQLWKRELDAKEAEEARRLKEENDRKEAERKAEEERQAKIAEENRKRQEELDRKQAELDAREKKQREAQEKIEREEREARERKEAEEREKQHQKELAEAREKAAEEARKQAEADAKRKEQERIEAEKAEKERREELEKQKPDNQKLATFIAFLSAIKYPEMKSKKGLSQIDEIKIEIQAIINRHK